MAVLSGWAWSAPSIQVLDSDERSSCRARSATKETPMQRRDINAADAPAPAGQYTAEAQSALACRTYRRDCVPPAPNINEFHFARRAGHGRCRLRR